MVIIVIIIIIIAHRITRHYRHQYGRLLSNKYYQFLPSGVFVGAGMVVGTENNEKTKQKQKTQFKLSLQKTNWEFPFYLEV